MDWAIKIGYAVMVFAIIMCFIFSKRGEKEMRHMVDRFAQAFCKLSNDVLPLSLIHIFAIFIIPSPPLFGQIISQV